MFSRSSKSKVHQFTQNKIMSHLLEAADYNPDTLIIDNPESKQYWFLCFQDLIAKLAKQASKSSSEADAEERAEKLRLHYIHELTLLQDEKK